MAVNPHKGNVLKAQCKQCSKEATHHVNGEIPLDLCDKHFKEFRKFKTNYEHGDDDVEDMEYGDDGE